MRLGKRPARENSVLLRLSDIVDAGKLPSPPPTFGHVGVRDWGVLGNDKFSDCVWAGAAHETTLWTRASGRVSAQFSTSGVLSDYSAATGFDGTSATDTGTDAQEAASYRRKIGVVDVAGQRHRIMAYMSLRRGDWDQLMLAAWLFGAVGVGVDYPRTAQRQFDAGKPWTVVQQDSAILGGHYVPVVGRNSAGMALVVTWGRLHAMTREFYERYNDETIAYFSPEYVNINNLSPEGFDAEALGNYLKELSQ